MNRKRKRLGQSFVVLVCLLILSIFIGFGVMAFSASPGYATTSTGPMITGGTGFNAVRLNDGKVFVTYGKGLGEIYDPSTGVFTAVTGTAKCTTRNSVTGITKLNDGRVFICGFGTPELFDQVTGLYAYTSVLLDDR